MVRPNVPCFRAADEAVAEADVVGSVLRKQIPSAILMVGGAVLVWVGTCMSDMPRAAVETVVRHGTANLSVCCLP